MATAAGQVYQGRLIWRDTLGWVTMGKPPGYSVDRAILFRTLARAKAYIDRQSGRKP